jgi:hypothetical protein
MNRPVYLITGPSGSGKTAIAGYLNDHGLTAIDADSTPGLCYFVNKNNKPVPYPAQADAAWWNTHNYVWELDRLAKLLGTLEDGKGPVFLSGNAGNITKVWQTFASVFYLDAPTKLLFTRINRPNREDSFGQRVEDPDQLVRWIEPFKAEMLSLGAIVVDANRPTETIAEDLIKRTTQT